MRLYSRRDYALLCGLIVAGGLLGWLFEAIGWGFTIALTAWVLLQHLEYSTLRSWADRPLQRPKFRTDAWQSVADTLFRVGRRQRERTSQALVRLRQMRSVTEALPDAAVMLDANGRIDSFNPAATVTLGLRSRDVGLPLTGIVRHPKLISMLRQDPAEPVEFDSPLQESVRLEARKIEVAPDRTLLLARDITQLNRLLSMRQDFVANVSHELRTPLTVILGYLETLQDDTLEPEQSVALIRKLVGPSQRMHALVQDLLMLTRLESSPELLDDDLEPVGVSSIFRQTIRAMEGLSAGAHDIRTEVSSEATVLGVANEIESAVGNLLANAIRYSPDGGVIMLSWRDEGNGAVLCVEDQGMGIASEHKDRLTERFYRVDLARSRFQGGTGLGLAIVKHVLKRHKTRLEIDSELGRGSRFFFRFSEEQLLRPQSTNPPAAAGSEAT